MAYKTILQIRRSQLHLANQTTLSLDQIEATLKDTLFHTPSSFNRQSQRMVVLFETSHQRFWSWVLEALEPIVPFAQIAKTKAKIDLFFNSLGTVLFFDDTLVTESLKKDFPLYAEDCASWALQQNGMLQINVWNALVGMGFQANLQHYTSLIEDKTKIELGLPSTWKMLGQMPFGVATQEPSPKKQVPIEEKMSVFR